MRLLYLFFKTRDGDHPIEGVDLNFDSEFRFEMSKGRLTCTRGVALPINFFTDASRVESVSAIVGANGAGKTAVARIISSLLRGSADIESWCVVAICDGKKVCATSMDFNVINGFDCEFCDAIPKNWKMVYISNHFSEKMQVEADGRRVLDYSTTGLVYRQASKRLEWGTSSDKVRYGDVGLYTSDQYSWTLKFLSALNGRGLSKQLKENTGVEFPKRIKVSVNQDLLDANYALFCEFVQGVERTADVHMQTVERVLKGDRSLSLFTGVFINIVGEYFRSHGMDPDYVREDDLARMLLYMADYLFCAQDEGQYFVGNVPEWNVYPIPEIQIKKEEATEEGVKRRILSYMCRLLRSQEELAHAGIYRFLSAFDSFIKKHGGASTEVVTVDLNDTNAVLDLVVMMKELPLFRDSEWPISFEIEPGMSSGELAYVVLWGRLYDAVNSGVREDEQVIFFFDEAETTLHPDWQRRLMSNILWMFEQTAPNVSAHLIMASHSPILLSDIPKGNVLFLFDSNNGERRNKQMQELKELSNTFGANIFDLLKLSFFMEDGALGVFAQRKIDKLLERVQPTKQILNGVVISSRRPQKDAFSDNDRKLSELVGDPFISSYLRRQLGR